MKRKNVRIVRAEARRLEDWVEANWARVEAELLSKKEVLKLVQDGLEMPQLTTYHIDGAVEVMGKRWPRTGGVPGKGTKQNRLRVVARELQRVMRELGCEPSPGFSRLIQQLNSHSPNESAESAEPAEPPAAQPAATPAASPPPVAAAKPPAPAATNGNGRHVKEPTPPAAQPLSPLSVEAALLKKLRQPGNGYDYSVLVRDVRNVILARTPPPGPKELLRELSSVAGRSEKRLAPHIDVWNGTPALLKAYQDGFLNCEETAAAARMPVGLQDIAAARARDGQRGLLTDIIRRAPKRSHV